jgi:predicted ester cyclase
MPDLRVTIDDMIAEGDRVALRWTTSGTQRGALDTPLGVAPPSNRPVSIPGINIFRIAGGKIAEEWIVWDTLGSAQQVGLAAPR